MAELCVKIDLARLGLRLSLTGGHAITPGEVNRWLHRHGFHYRGAWYCEPASLRHLMPGELAELIRTETENGVAFVEHIKPDVLGGPSGFGAI